LHKFLHIKIFGDMLASPATRAPTPLFLHHKENTKVTATVTKVSLR